MSTQDEQSLEAYLFHRYQRDEAETTAWRAPPSAPGRDLVVRTDDGVPLAATLYVARGTEERADRADGATAPPSAPVVVVASATGVLRRYYAPFASWLASHGFSVVTFDYRGIGGSRGDGDREMKSATMREWGELDLAAVIAWAADVLGDGRVALVGHSVGGQLVGLLSPAAASRIVSVVTVASQSGDYRLWPMPHRLAMAALWYGLVPGVTHAVGYLPGSLGIGEDLPAGVALEWARWCRTPGYLLAEDEDSRREGFARVRAPMLAFAFDDDTYAPPAAVESLLSLYVNASIRRRRLGREDGRGGHIGFFRSRHEPLWREVVAHLVQSIG